MNEADPQGFLGGEALAREQIAAQAARVDRAQKERNERPRREAEPHLRQREERVVRGDDDVATGDDCNGAADAGTVDERDGRLGYRIEREANGGNGRARLLLGGGTPTSAPALKCLPLPRSTIERTAGSAPSRPTSSSSVSSMA